MSRGKGHQSASYWSPLPYDSKPNDSDLVPASTTAIQHLHFSVLPHFQGFLLFFTSNRTCTPLKVCCYCTVVDESASLLVLPNAQNVSAARKLLLKVNTAHFGLKQ
jgi:hypothetical protein